MSDAKIAYFDDAGRAIFRASAVNKCTKALVASFLGFDAMEPNEAMQARFDAGHLYEPELLNHMRMEGWNLYGMQETLEVPLGESIIIRGHPDALGSHPQFGFGLIEAKTMAPKSYELWLKKRFTGSDLFRHYADQVALYWDAVKPAVLAMVCGRKEFDEAGECIGIDAIDVSLFFEPPASVARIKARLAKVLNQARTGELPDECDKSDYPCPFYPLHSEKVDAPIWVNEEILDDFAKAGEAYLAGQVIAKDGKKQMADAKKDIDRLLDGHTTGASGRYQVEYVNAPKTSWDEDAMRADGIDVDKYKTTTPGKRINVKEVQQ